MLERLPIYPCSLVAQQYIADRSGVKRKRSGSRYPFALLSVGESFGFPAAQMKAASMKSMCDVLAPHLNMRFKVFTHTHDGVDWIEVARVE